MIIIILLRCEYNEYNCIVLYNIYIFIQNKNNNLKRRIGSQYFDSEKLLFML